MSNRITRALLLSACFGVVLTYAGTVQAQDRAAANDKQLTAIETLATQLQNAKTNAEKDRLADTFESRLAAYAKAMLSSFDSALKQAQTAAKSPPRSDSFAPLKRFEDHLQSHENRLKQLDSRMQKLKPQSSLQLFEGRTVALGWLLGQIGDAVISPAQAAIALSIYNVCSVSPSTPASQAACTKAISTGHNQRVAAQATFNACWNKYENTRPKWWRATLRAGCVTFLVARLA